MLKNEHVVYVLSLIGHCKLDPKFDPFGCASCIPGGGVWFAHRGRGGSVWYSLVCLHSPRSTMRTSGKGIPAVESYIIMARL